jgi:hypothetical protein
MNREFVYIVLTGTGTVFSETIKWFTKEPLNHASISFDSELKEVYSFGRKKVSNPFTGGLIQENFREPFYHHANCAIYRYYVGDQNYAAMHGHVTEMMSNKDRYKYDLIGLFGILLKKRFPRENAYFCSQFVASVLEKTGYDAIGKPSYFVTPGDIGLSLSSNEIYRGTVSDYINKSRNALIA